MVRWVEICFSLIILMLTMLFCGAGESRWLEPLVREPLVREPLVTEPLVREPLVREPLVREPLVTEPLLILHLAGDGPPPRCGERRSRSYSRRSLRASPPH